MRNVKRSVIRKWQKVDVLVNNAAMMTLRPLGGIDLLATGTRQLTSTYKGAKEISTPLRLHEATPGKAGRTASIIQQPLIVVGVLNQSRIKL